jgi:membrane protease YdiL (CAAX protease family)
MTIDKPFAYAPIDSRSILSKPLGAILSCALALFAVWCLVQVQYQALFVYSTNLGEPDLAYRDMYWFSVVAYLLQTWLSVAVIIGVLAWIKRIETRPSETAGIVWPPRRVLLLAFAAGVVLVTAYQIAGALQQIAVPQGPVKSMGSVALETPGYAPWPLALNLMAMAVLLFAIAISSIAEEFFYRAWMLSALAAVLRVPLAVLISGVFFALTHIGPSDMTTTGKVLSFLEYNVASAMLAIIAMRQGVWAASMFHIGQNLTYIAIDAVTGSGDARYVIHVWDQPRGVDDAALATLTLSIGILALAALWTRCPQTLALSSPPQALQSNP